MNKWRKILSLLLTAALLTLSFSGCKNESATVDPPPRIALMPLDSRPCNTQYPQTLAEACNAKLLMPSLNDMDVFTTDANREALWQWLEKTATDSDHLIVFTNTLFCGGLINSRNSNAYTHVEEDLVRFETLCDTFKSDHPKGTITVIQVLPRLHPNQYDDLLYFYGDMLKDYGIAWDAADVSNVEPTTPDTIPSEIVEAYRNLHQTAGEMALSLNAMAQDGRIDHLLISQDDGEVSCPANITFRTIQATQSDRTDLIHGADELAMLLVVDTLSDKLPATPVRVVYSDDSQKTVCYPYEAIPLEDMVAEKLALANLTATDDDTATTLYLHCTTDDASATAEAINAADGVFGIADIALTNQSDPALTPLLTDQDNFDRISAYAGWNTAGNSIGTVCAVLRLHALIDAQFDSIDKDAAADALLRFRGIRYAEDLGFMTGIRRTLHQSLEDDGSMNDRLVFADESAYQHAKERLAEDYAPFNAQISPLFDGDHTLTFGEHHLKCTVQDFSSTITFPWPRAFEVLADIQLNTQT